MALPATAVAVGLVAGVSFVGNWLIGRRIARRDRPDTAFHRARRISNRVTLGGLIVALWLVDARLTERLLAVLAPGLDGTDIGSMVWIAVYGTVAIVVLSAGYLGLFPHARRARGTEATATTDFLRILRSWGSVLVITVVAVGVLHVGLAFIQFELGTGGGVGYVLLMFSIVLPVLYATAPLILRLGSPVREPTSDERERIERLCNPVNLTVSKVWLLKTTEQKRISSTVYGVPSRRVLFLSDYALDSLDDSELSAIMAAEVQSRRTYTLVYEMVATSFVAVGIVACLELIALGTPPVVWVIAISSLPLLWVGLAWGGRRLVYRADAAAAEQVGTRQLVEAYTRRADLHDADLDDGGLRTLWSMEPPMGRRIDRLTSGRTSSK